MSPPSVRAAGTAVPLSRPVLAGACALAVVLTGAMLASPGEPSLAPEPVAEAPVVRTLGLPASPRLVMTQSFEPGDTVDVLVAGTPDHPAAVLEGAEVVAVPRAGGVAVVVAMDDDDVRSLLATIDGSLVIVTRAAV